MGKPRHYECNVCGARGVKLWRDYQTFLDQQRLFCRSCAEKDQTKPNEIPTWRKYGGDQIGWFVPAVPDKLPTGKDWKLPRDYTFWGYTSVPNEGVDWWYGLHGIGRLIPSSQLVTIKSDEQLRDLYADLDSQACLALVLGEYRDLRRYTEYLLSVHGHRNRPDSLTQEEWDALMKIIENPPPAPEWLRKALMEGSG